MENYIDILIRRYIRLGLAIDTNLMLLFLVGRLDLQKIGKFKSTSKFSIRNFQLLDRIVTKFPRKYTTSNVMTEVDNLSRQVPRSEWSGISQTLGRIMADLTEVSFGSTDLFDHDAHAAIGITDCSLMNLAEQGFLIITDDLPLTATLEKRRFDVVNFSRIIPLDRD